MSDFNPIEIQKHLKGVEYPASKEDLLSTAEDNGAPDDVIDQLEGLDQDSFDGPDEVMEAIADA